MFKKILFILLGIIVALLAVFLVIGLVSPTYNDTVSVTVNAPASKTFAVFNNPENMGKWMGSFKSIRNISGAENEPGSKWELIFDENGSDLVMIETVTAFEQDKLFAFEIDDSFAKFNISIRFEENNGQTTITETTQGEGKSLPAKSMIAIVKGRIKKQKQEMYDKLKTLV